MTVFEKIKTMDIEEFAEWFEENCTHDGDPCVKWYDETYCQKCEPVVEGGREYAYCELNGRCKYLSSMESLPSAKETVKMWLESGAENI